jgi:ADP-ribosylglycohydrolase
LYFLGQKYEGVMNMNEERVVGGILGVVTGDALGLPVQFLTRTEVRRNPVIEMRGGGTFDTPPGTWSDDGSLTLCLVKSLIEKGYNLKDIAERFVRWFQDGYCTPFDQAFDIGYSTRVAMKRLIKGSLPLEAGPSDEGNNGNGSLMRILPAVLYFSHLPDVEMIQKVCEVSKITHGHPRSQLGCSLYALFVKGLLAGESPDEAFEKLRVKGQEVFKGTELQSELTYYKRLIDGTLPQLNEDEIESSGYVVHTLEAAVWCFLTTRSYKEALLKAVNLGLDTDTVGAVTGGLAGVYYGLAGIPEKWMSKIIKRSEILDLGRDFTQFIIQ